MDDCKFSQFHEFEQKSVNDYFKQSVFIFEVKGILGLVRGIFATSTLRGGRKSD